MLSALGFINNAGLEKKNVNYNIVVDVYLSEITTLTSNFKKYRIHTYS